jgi:hypothetical protein
VVSGDGVMKELKGSHDLFRSLFISESQSHKDRENPFFLEKRHSYTHSQAPFLLLCKRDCYIRNI